MGANDFRLGVDFGTSNTMAVLRWPDGRVRPLLFDGSPLLTSAVFVGPDGQIAVGRAAVHAARTQPERFEPYPKRCIDDGAVLLGPAGSSTVPVVELIAAVLRRVAEEATRTAGHSVRHAVLTCPAAWAQTRRNSLLAAAHSVFPDVSLVPEPVAAASHFVAVRGGAVPVGSSLLIYDLGAGTFDTSLVRRTADGFEVLAADGLTDAGGLDVDAAMVAFLGTIYAGRNAAAWERLNHPVDGADRRLSRALWDDVRTGKELLSNSANVAVHVPLFSDDVPFGREQVEDLAQPIIARTVAVVRAMLRAAGVDAARLSGVYLVGGGSRLPLVGTMLHRALRIAPTTVEQPELVVAEGSLHADRLATKQPPVAVAPARPAMPPAPAGRPPARQPAPNGPVVAPTRNRSRRGATVGVAAIMVVTLLSGQLVADKLGGSSGENGGGDDPGRYAPASAATPIDDCLVGTWRVTNQVAIESVDLDDDGGKEDVEFTGSGAIHRYWSDGRTMLEYGDGTSLTARRGGHEYEIVLTGRVTSMITTSGGKIISAQSDADGTRITKADGSEIDRTAMPEDSGSNSSNYQCSDGLLNRSGSGWQSTSEQISRDPDAAA
ncbi:Hsp70 family protein [Plantactinospora sp. DSM 117369]